MSAASEMIGEAAAALMDNIHEGAQPVAAMVILAYDVEEYDEDLDVGEGGVQFHCTYPRWFEQLGLIRAAEKLIDINLERAD